MADTLSLLLTAAAIILNLTSSMFFAEKMQKQGTVTFVSAWSVSVTLLILNWVSSGHPPFANMYHVLSALPIVLMPMLLRLKKTESDFVWASWAFPALATVLCTATLFMDRSLDWSLNPALDSIFFVPHVSVYCISYAMSALAFIMGIAFFADRKNSDRYLSASHVFIRISLPFMTLGMCLGAIWAEQAWGIYWSWDAKETFSLVTWLIYLGFLHLMRMKHSKVVANIVQTVGFAALLMTFFGVNLLQSIHAY